MPSWREWVPAVILGTGALLGVSVRETQEMALRAPLATVPDTLLDHPSVALRLSDEELRVNGASDYLLRAYVDSAGEEKFGLYVGYYASQSQGKTIHSPKNCLPGGGWEPVSHAIVDVPTEGRPVPVNRYVIAREGAQAIVYYWYQGRNRVAADEYGVKWDLLRDAALRSRSEEALVRLVLPISDAQSAEAADTLARAAIRSVVPALFEALPS
jgi:EpsI family protein